eukprot:SAG31_NODE_30_length_32545_cov_9.378999_14_plen_41_part_00
MGGYSAPTAAVAGFWGAPDAVERELAGYANTDWCEPNYEW